MSLVADNTSVPSVDILFRYSPRQSDLTIWARCNITFEFFCSLASADFLGQIQDSACVAFVTDWCIRSDPLLIL